jgi:hypothetical protein
MKASAGHPLIHVTFCLGQLQIDALYRELKAAQAAR